MAKFNLVHCLSPIRKMHGLNGYKEIIDTVAWGLSELGHDVSRTVNEFEFGARNIIFGAHIHPINVLEKYTNDTIVYNFEQMRDIDPTKVRPEAHYIAKHFEIWEYSPANLESWAKLGATKVKVVPVGYAPVLSRIEKSEHQDIDVLMYGLTGDKRLNAFHLLSRAGLSAVYASGLYGEARDNLISRSKIVLNINLYSTSQIFEIVRVSYLLANKKAVVATLDSKTFVEDYIKPGIKFTTLEKIVEDCIFLIDNDQARLDLENAGFNAFSERDLKKIIGEALSSNVP